MSWLLASIDPGRDHMISMVGSWHARLMFLAWGVLAPLGIIAARFFKVMPGQDWPVDLDNRTWWNLHRLLQYGAVLLMLAGLCVVVMAGSGQSGAVHFWLGWAVVGLGCLQVVSAWLRGSKGGPTAPARDGSWRGDHYDMSPRRVLFEYVHKTCGYLAVLLAVGAVVAGLWHVNASRWMWLGIVCWWGFLGAAFWVLQCRGMALDSYDAIWGDAPIHPGLRRSPIGWAVKRRKDRGRET